MYPSPYIRFDGYREQSEWFEGCSAGREAGRRVHPALYVLVLAAGFWHYRNSGEPAVVTHLLRTREEQQSLYPGRAGLRSPHEFGRAADLRTRDLDGRTALEWAEWLNQAFEYRGRQGAMTAVCHELENHGQHLHLQVGPRDGLPAVPESFVVSG
ncbi:MAG: hypothetical protein JXQ83_05975 [Candidatus Glassbacteria bacterium]|nr:hypothetical protein [Candidatus Glassbacteria bacterium]